MSIPFKNVKIIVEANIQLKSDYCGMAWPEIRRLIIKNAAARTGILHGIVQIT
jgi:hypothetical protein